MKRLSLFLVLGLVFGTLLSTWLGPKVIGWWFQPPVGFGVDCGPALRWAMHRLILVQISGMAAGLILGALLAFSFRGKKTE